ncbi:MAG: hypothetical protein Q9182_004134 [Xanthomendoza sp. 2 TL-2023]
MFTCKALEEHPKANGGNVHGLAREYGAQFRYAEAFLKLKDFEYHLLACAKKHFDISPKSENEFLALALQYSPLIDQFDHDEKDGGHTFNAKFRDHTNARFIYAEGVDKIFKQMESGEDAGQIYKYWDKYNKADKKSSHPFTPKPGQAIPSFEKLEAYLRAVLYKAFEPDTTKSWKMEKGIETV